MAINYVSGLLLGQEERSDRSRRLVLGVTVVIDLAILGTWKYAGFFTEQVASLSDALGFEGVGRVRYAIAVDDAAAASQR